MKEVKLSVSLSPAQKTIMSSKARFKLIRAGRRFGKTWIAIYWLAKRALTIPNSVNWYIAHELKQCREFAIPLIKSILPVGTFTESKQDLTLKLFNGSIICFKTAENMDTLRGRAVDSVVMEEFALVKHQHELWFDIVRPMLADRIGHAMIISSPKGNNTFKTLEVDAKGNPEWSVFHYTIYDNPKISHEEIESIKKSQPLPTWQQEYLAEYVDKVGTVYHEFTDSNIADLSPVNVKLTCVGLDWGIGDNATSAIVDILGTDQIYLKDYTSVNNASSTVAAAGILQKVNSLARLPRFYVLDSSSFKRERDLGSVANDYKRAGISPLYPATKDLDSSVSYLKGLFEANKLYIDPKLTQIIKFLREWQYGQHEPDELAALRYAIAKAAELGHVKNFGISAWKEPTVNQTFLPLRKTNTSAKFTYTH